MKYAVIIAFVLMLIDILLKIITSIRAKRKIKKIKDNFACILSSEDK